MRAVREQTPVSVRLTNYTKSGEAFVHQLSCEPLRDPSGETKCFQATSLVLQAPGEAPTNFASVVGAMPPICTNAVPPLWPLLGRAVRPDDAAAACFRALPQRGNQPSAPAKPVGGSMPRLFMDQQAAHRCVSDGACSAGSQGGSDVHSALEKFDDDFLDWLESSREGSDLSSTFISRIETEMADV